jgi:hypothetical protein
MLMLIDGSERDGWREMDGVMKTAKNGTLYSTQVGRRVWPDKKNKNGGLYTTQIGRRVWPDKKNKKWRALQYRSK